jgi:hypothetical protein
LETPSLVIKRDVEPKIKKLLNKIAHRDIYELDAK